MGFDCLMSAANESLNYCICAHRVVVGAPPSFLSALRATQDRKPHPERACRLAALDGSLSRNAGRQERAIMRRHPTAVSRALPLQTGCCCCALPLSSQPTLNTRQLGRKLALAPSCWLSRRKGSRLCSPRVWQASASRRSASTGLGDSDSGRAGRCMLLAAQCTGLLRCHWGGTRATQRCGRRKVEAHLGILQFSHACSHPTTARYWAERQV